MYIRAIKTSIVKIGDSLTNIIDEYIKDVSPNSVIAISSKIVSIAQSRIVAIDTINKNELIASEADAFIKNKEGGIAPLTMKDSRFIPFAGIDESNGNNFYILYPLKPMEVAYSLLLHIQQKFGDKIGVIITDSNITPLRKGVTGIAVAWAGFKPTYSYVGVEDLFGRKMQLTSVNVVDSLANMAVFAMGEGAESTPLAVIADISRIEFCSTFESINDRFLDAVIELERDFYYPLISSVNWQNNKD